MKTLLYILKLTFVYRKTTLLVIFSNLFFVIFNVLSLVLFIPFLSVIFNPEEQQALSAVKKPVWESSTTALDYFTQYFDHLKADFILEKGLPGALAFICIAVLIAFFLKNVFRYGAVYYQSYLRMAVVRDLRENLFIKSTSLPLSYHSEEKKGDLLSRMTSDLNEVEIAVVFALEMLFREPIALIINLTVLFYISVDLTLFSLVLLPISAIIISRIGKSLKRTSKKGQIQMGELLSSIEESIGGIRIIKAFTAEKQALKRFRNKNNHHQNLITRAFRKRDLSSPLNEFFGACVLISIVWFGGSLILEDNGSMTGKTFIGYVVIFSQMMVPISGFTKGLTSMKKAEASLDRINEILDTDNPIKEPQNPVSKSSLDSEVKFQNVSFSYVEDEQVLQDISFTLEKGKTVALVGESGSGKSTISDLIPRFHDVNLGSIEIDKVNIKDIGKTDLRKLIAIVAQESILFNDTVKNNISFGNPNATEEEIINAAKIANAHDFIESFENSYETNIGDRGNKLSGGQKQRISIARAVLSDAPIMILDEATSALDTESEKQVQDALDRLMKNRTSLVIAHRLSTIRNADEIIVLKKGVIVEQGNHDSLIAEKGYYKSLCEIQQLI